MYEDRLKTIKAICEKLKNQPHKPKLRIKSKRQVITSHKAKVRKIPSWCIDRFSWCIDRLPCDAQILGEDGIHTYVYH
ncbi:hypothetical protein UD636_01480 [Citrobacter braakii]